MELQVGTGTEHGITGGQVMPGQNMAGQVARLCRIGRSDKPLQEHWPCESTVAAADS